MAAGDEDPSEIAASLRRMSDVGGGYHLYTPAIAAAGRYRALCKAQSALKERLPWDAAQALGAHTSRRILAAVWPAQSS
jgi:hypothetical protein